MSTLWVDNAIIVLLVLYALGGVFRGFKQELYSLFIWLLGIVVAWTFSQNFSLFFLKLFTSPLIRLGASFAALLTITLLVGTMINLLLGEMVKKRNLTFVDRCGGVLLGVFHGLMPVFVLVLIAGLTPLPKDRWWRESAYIPPFQALLVFIKSNSSSRLARVINFSTS